MSKRLGLKEKGRGSMEKLNAWRFGAWRVPDPFVNHTVFVRKNRFGFTPRLVLFAAAMVALSVTLSSLLVYRSNKEALQASLGRELLAAVNALAPQIDADLHELIHRKDEKSISGEEEFEAIRLLLVRAKSSLGLKSQGSPIYTMRPLPGFENTGDMEFVVMTDRDASGSFFVGNQYRAQEHNRKAMQGEPSASRVYEDSEGIWISASAPIRNGEGKVVAILQADRPVNFFYAEARHQAAGVLRGALVSVGIALLVALLLARTITKPIRMLAGAARSLGRGDFKARVEIERSDELGELAGRFNDMAESLEAAHETEARQRSELIEARGRVEEANAQLNRANEELNEANDELSRMNGELNRTNGQLERMVVASNRLAEEAQAANRTKGEFLATMSHELRTPMNAVLGFTELLRESSLSPDQVEYVNTVHSNAARLLQMINQLLTYSTLDTVKQVDPQEPVDLPAMLIQTVRGLCSEMEVKGLECRLKIPEPFPGVLWVDKGLMQHVVGNLLQNAVKFTEKGWVGVEVEMVATGESRAGQELWDLNVAVMDTGIGVPAEKVGNLFKMFSQLDGSFTRAHGGMGMGLALAHKIVEKWKGRLWYEPRLEGGSCFRFKARVPVVPDVFSTSDTGFQASIASASQFDPVWTSQNAALAEVSPDLIPLNVDQTNQESAVPDTEIRLRTGRRIRVLVVGDEVNSVGSLTEVLIRQGHHPEAAPASRFAVMLARKKKFDLLLIRFETGDAMASQILRQIRAVHAGEDRGASSNAVAVAFHRKPDRPDPSQVEVAGFVHVLSNVTDDAEIASIMKLLSRKFAA